MADTTQLRGVLEALLFVSDEPVAAARLARLLEASPGDVESALADLAEQYVLSWDTRRVSQAALEARAVVAYHQPVTRAGVNAVRGVNSEGVLASLVEKGLVREVGRDKNAGNAILYGTTRNFLEKFGLKDIAELPPLAEFAPDTDTEHAIRERLSAGEPALSRPDESASEDLEMID